jgi:hypothetical protein
MADNMRQDMADNTGKPIGLAPAIGEDNAAYATANGLPYRRRRPTGIDPKDELYNQSYMKGRMPPDDATDWQ